MIAEFKPITIVPVDEPADQTQAFREVVAYLKGVADTVSAQHEPVQPLSLHPASLTPLSLRPASLGPLSLQPLSSLRPLSSLQPLSCPAIASSSLPPSLLRTLSLQPASMSSILTCGEAATADECAQRETLRFGEPALSGGAGRATQTAGGLAWEPTRGGARLIDPGSVRPLLENDPALVWRRTLPYGAPTVSLAASGQASSWVDNERTSEVRLRNADLPREWYELTGTEVGAF